MMRKDNKSLRKKFDYDITLIAIPIVLVVALCLWFVTDPEGSLASLNHFGNFFVEKTGWFFLLFGAFMFGFSMWWAFSKRGKIRLGGENAVPTYSFGAYIAMVFSAGMAASSVIFSMVEWMLYYAGPPFGVTPYTNEAAEWAMTYNFFNWGLTPACLTMLLAIPFCYSYHIRKNPSLQLGDVVATLIGPEKKGVKVLSKIVNLIFIICILGSLCCTMGMGVPNITRCLCTVFGWKNETLISIIFILVVSVVFSFSSYLGIGKGLAKLSKLNVYWCGLFLVIILFGGSTLFILNNITDSLGSMIQHFPEMLLNADAINNYGFAQNWTIFFYCFAWGFVAMSAVVVTKISYGRTYKEMILGNTLGVACGLWVMMGINNSNSMSLQLNGVLDIVNIFETEGQHAAIIATLGESVLGPVVGVIFFAVMIILFLATTMDAASLSLASACMKAEKMDQEPSPFLRLLWCLVLAAVPFVLTLLGAGLESLQAICNLAGWPIMIVGIYVLFKVNKWAKEDGY